MRHVLGVVLILAAGPVGAQVPDEDAPAEEAKPAPPEGTLDVVVSPQAPPVADDDGPAPSSDETSPPPPPGAPAPGADTSDPQPTPAPAPAAAPEAERPTLLVLGLENRGLDAGAVATVDDTLTAALSRVEVFNVISSEDIQRISDLEATKAQMGCDESSCLSEIAGALGAELVVFGSAGRVGETLVFTLSLFDADEAKSVSRVSLSADELGDLPFLIPAEIPTLLGPVLPPDRRAAILKDLQARAAQATADLEALQKKRADAAAAAVPKGFGMIVVKTNPPGARVFLDDKEVGVSPLTLEDVPSGDRKISARTDTQNGEVAVRLLPDAVERVTVALGAGPPVRLKIVSNPPDVRVFLDGKEVGVAPLILDDVPSGEHRLRGVLKGHRPIERTVFLSGDAYVAAGSVPLRESMKLASAAADRQRCVAGDRAMCHQVAAAAWESAEPEVTIGALAPDCEAGAAQVCAFLGVQHLKAGRAAQGSELIERSCQAGHALSCRAHVGRVLENRAQQSEAHERIVEQAASFLVAKPDLTFTPDDDLQFCQEEGECRALCDKKEGRGCLELGRIRLAEAAQFSSSPEREQEKLAAALPPLEEACRAELDEGCKEFRLHRDRYNDTFGRRASIWGIVLTIPLSAIPVGIGIVVGYVGGLAFALLVSNPYAGMFLGDFGYDLNNYGVPAAAAATLAAGGAALGSLAFGNLWAAPIIGGVAGGVALLFLGAGSGFILWNNGSEAVPDYIAGLVGIAIMLLSVPTATIAAAVVAPFFARPIVEEYVEGYSEEQE